MPAGCLPPRSKRTWTFACDLLGYRCRRRGLAFFLKRKALFHVGRLLGHLALAQRGLVQRRVDEAADRVEVVAGQRQRLLR